MEQKPARFEPGTPVTIRAALDPECAMMVGMTGTIVDVLKGRPLIEVRIQGVDVRVVGGRDVQWVRGTDETIVIVADRAPAEFTRWPLKW